MEHQPLKINLQGEEIELDPRNTAIVRYIARFAIHNHIHIRHENASSYIFRDCKGSDDLNAALEDRSYPMALHLPEPTEEVVQRHYDTLMAMSEDENIEEEVEKWRRLFEK